MSQITEFAAAATEDKEVQSLFEQIVETSGTHERLLRARLSELGADGPSIPLSITSSGVDLFTMQRSKVTEEEVLRSILSTYVSTAGQCALYDTLVALAGTAGDEATKALAEELGQTEQGTAERIWHLIPTRSKIAFNMLTVSEVDPAVETKLKDDRVES
jgi:ferritin-like metal-binding protein YciE